MLQNNQNAKNSILSNLNYFVLIRYYLRSLRIQNSDLAEQQSSSWWSVEFESCSVRLKEFCVRSRNLCRLQEPLHSEEEHIFEDHRASLGANCTLPYSSCLLHLMLSWIFRWISFFSYVSKAQSGIYFQTNCTHQFLIIYASQNSHKFIRNYYYSKILIRIEYYQLLLNSNYINLQNLSQLNYL